MTLRDKDHGYKKRLASIASMKDPEVAIGILTSEGAVDHGGTTVLEVAIWQEFGTRTIPARSFLRGWFDENRTEATEMWKGLMRSVAKGSMTKDRALNLFGLHCVGQIQQRIANRIPPPLSPSTLKSRPHGGSVPLIDTGLLRSSITFAIREHT